MAAPKRAPKGQVSNSETKPGPGRRFPVVGIGASAGGLEAFRQLLQALPTETGLAFVLVQHLDPVHESMLTRILSKSTSMPVVEVQEGMAVERNHVYVIPPNRIMAISDGILHLTEREESALGRLPIDHFLRSLAEDQGARSVGVILSGTASDGTRGLKAIKAEGGITFAQDEQSATYGGMPRSAVAAGCVDFVLPPEKIAKELARIGRHPYLEAGVMAEIVPVPIGDDVLRRIFDLLRKVKGVDFTDYKYATIRRRIGRRMVLRKMDDLKAYLNFLRENNAELEALYEDFLIHVTGFFREPETFQALSEEVLPRILKSKRPGEELRAWVPGCSTGEEPYSVAIAVLEHLGDRASSTLIQIFGTDISEASISKARTGIYSEAAVADVAPERLRHYFVKVEGGYQIIKSIREMCIFARQDLPKDPPFSRLDLISCRNVLIYMGPVLQKKVMGIFHYALKPGGFLLLGKSESISESSALFEPLDRKSKVHVKRPGEERAVFDLSGPEPDRAAEEQPPRKEASNSFDVQKEADKLILQRYAPAGVIVNDEMHIRHFRGDCSAYVSPASGEASLALLKMVRPEFAVELRAAAHKARRTNGPVRHEGVPYKRNGETRRANIEVMPIAGPAGERSLLVVFEDMPQPAQAKSKGTHHKAGVAKAQETEIQNLRRELQRTKEYHQSILEEQEATNEELKSANEEVLSSNEELQSTNEELETAKEELQSANEELVTVNEQLQNRNAELGNLNDDLANLLAGVNIPVVMLDNDHRIRRFTLTAEQLLNLVPADLGRPIHNIRSNITIPELDREIRKVIETMSVYEQELQAQDGRWYSVRIRPYKTLENRIEGAVIVFVDIDAAKKIEIALREERDFVTTVLDTVPAPVIVLDSDERIIGFNRACQTITGYSLPEVLNRRPSDFLVVRSMADGVRADHRKVIAGSPAELEYEWIAAKSGERRLISWTSGLLRDEAGAVKCLILSGIDVTVQRQIDEALRRSEAALRQSEDRLRVLAAGLLDLQERERERLARDLHDDLSQRVAALALEASALVGSGVAKGEAGFRNKLESLVARSTELCTDLESIAHELHPASIEKLGLVPSLESLIAEIVNRYKVKVQFTREEIPAFISDQVALGLYRIAQEALRNFVRHSGAKRARVRLATEDGGLLLKISDSGRGFNAQDMQRSKGLGLISMSERARILGGMFSVTAKDGQGVKIEARIPLSPAAETEEPKE